MEFAGRLLKTFRALHELRQADVAQILRTNVTRIHRIEAGKLRMRDSERAALERMLESISKRKQDRG